MVTINGLIIHVDILVGNIWIISLCVKNNFDRKKTFRIVLIKIVAYNIRFHCIDNCP